MGGWGFRARGRERNDGGRSQALEKEDAEISKKTKKEAWIADSVNVVFPNKEVHLTVQFIFKKANNWRTLGQQLDKSIWLGHFDQYFVEQSTNICEYIEFGAVQNYGSRERAIQRLLQRRCTSRLHGLGALSSFLLPGRRRRRRSSRSAGSRASTRASGSPGRTRSIGTHYIWTCRRKFRLIIGPKCIFRTEVICEGWRR